MKCLGTILGILVCVTVSRADDVNELVKQLREGDNEARRGAARALADGKAESKEAVPALIKALKDQDAFVRRYSAQALGEIGPEARSAAIALTEALNDSRKEVQSSAARALGKIGPSGVEALINMIKDGKKDSSIRRQAIDALGGVGDAAHSAVPALTEMVKGNVAKGKKKQNGTEDLRMDAINALGSIAKPDDKETIQALQALTDKKAKVRRELRQAANSALGKIQNNVK